MHLFFFYCSKLNEGIDTLTRLFLATLDNISRDTGMKYGLIIRTQRPTVPPNVQSRDQGFSKFS